MPEKFDWKISINSQRRKIAYRKEKYFTEIAKNWIKLRAESRIIK
jgi:hypothetical protein